MSDLDIGMNDWMCPELDWDPAYRPDRGKVLSAAELEAAKTFHRYVDVDGDGIPQRTLPGVHPRGAYFVRGSGHNQYGGYTEDAAEYQQVVDRLAKKWQTAAKLVPEPVIRRSRKGAALGVVAVGSCDAADRRGARSARGERHLRRLLPHPRVPVRQEGAAVPRAARARVRRRAESRRAVEDSAAGRDCNIPAARLQSILHYGGLPMDHRCVTEALEQYAARGVAA